MKCGQKDYRIVNHDEYSEAFGIGSDRDSEKTKMREAYKRAWHNRDFEIDKFWTRSAYFWGFIAAIFVGYITVMTSEFGQEARMMNLDGYLAALGLLFSIAWLLIIKGSKCWQENWEAHIDQLEDEITGPLYKIICCKKGKPYYSVSKISELMAKIVIGTWAILLFNHLIPVFKKYGLCIIGLLIAIIIGGIITMVLLFRKCKSAGNGYTIKFPNGVDECFIVRKEKEIIP